MARYDVAFFTPYTGPILAAQAGIAGAGTTGGAETQVFLLARELASRGRRVAVAAFQGDVPLPSSVEGITVIPLTPRPSGGRLATMAWRLRFIWSVARMLDADVLVQRNAGTATALVALIARLRRRRFVYSSSSVMDFDFARLERRSTVRLFRMGVRMADTVVVQSVEQEALCRRAFDRSSEVILSLAKPAPLRDERPEALLWIGRFAPYKRPRALLELAAEVPEACFWIVGTHSPLAPGLGDALREEAAALENVELLPPRTQEEIVQLVRHAVAVVNTSEFEGVSNVLLEAWSCGVPALALAHDPDGLIVGERLGWFADGDPKRLAEQAREAWRARDDQDALARRCWAYAQRCHWPSAVVDQWEAILFGSDPSPRPVRQPAEQQAVQAAR